METYMYMYGYWLVVWNMAFIFPYIGNNNPNWRTHIFQRGRYTTNQEVLFFPWFPWHIPIVSSWYFMFLSPRYSHDILDPPAIFHVAMENSLLIDNVPIKTFTYRGFSVATCDYLRVIVVVDEMIVPRRGFTLMLPASALGRDVQRMVCERLAVKAGVQLSLVHQEMAVKAEVGKRRL